MFKKLDIKLLKVKERKKKCTCIVAESAFSSTADVGIGAQPQQNTLHVIVFH